MLTTAVETGKLKFHKAGSLQADYTKKTSWSVPQQTAEGTVSYTNCVNIMFQIKTHQTWVSFLWTSYRYKRPQYRLLKIISTWLKSCDKNKVTITTHKINDKQACTNKDKVCEIHLYIIFYNNKCNFSFHHHEPSEQHARQESNKRTSWVP